MSKRTRTLNRERLEKKPNRKKSDWTKENMLESLMHLSGMSKIPENLIFWSISMFLLALNMYFEEGTHTYF